MRKIVTGQTLDEAINNAMIELSVSSDNLVYTVIKEGTNGFLGIGAKPFEIEAYRKDDKEEIYKEESINKKEKLVQDNNGVYEFKSQNKKFTKEKKQFDANYEELKKIANDFLLPVLKQVSETVSLEYELEKEENTIVINIIGDKMGLVIGKHGQTLDSLQYLTNIVVNKDIQNKVKIRIDCEQYRNKRYKTLETLAQNVANNVRKSKKCYELEPMSSYERRIIHSVLQKEKNIETESVGNDNNRHVIVKYKRY